MDAGIQAILSELRERLQAIYGSRLDRLVLFGSQARGEAVAGSDVDVLVVLQGPVDAGLEIARTGGVVIAQKPIDNLLARREIYHITKAQGGRYGNQRILRLHV